MLFFATIVTLFSLLSAALSLPLSSEIESRATKEYRLQTRIVNNKNDKGTFKGKLWVSSYHTGAGLSDVVLIKNGTEGVKGYLNGTIQQFDLGTDFPWYMAMGGDANYAGKCTELRLPRSSDVMVEADCSCSLGTSTN
jgi:hypothetical protein